MGYALVQLFAALRYKPKDRRLDSHWCPPGRIVALRSTHHLKNEYHGYFLGVKEAGTTFLKSGNLRLLETAGPVQGCTGIALTLTKHHASTPIICATGNRKIIAGASIRITEVHSLFRGK